MDDMFMQLFHHACCESSTKAVVERGKKDPAYLDAYQRSRELFAALQQQLGERDEELFQLEDSQNAESALREEWIYQQAFQDCFRLLQWMGAIRQS